MMVEVEEVATANHVEGNASISVAADSCDLPGAEAKLVGESDEPSAKEPVQRVPPHVSLTPPEDCIAVTKDRGVLKKIVEPGETNDKPSIHARCLVHYVGYLASSGEVFMDTRTDRETEEPAVVVAGRTAAAQETGLSLAASTMSRGEKALVYIQDPVYGYGALGSFSFPCVPPNSQLVYEVHMVNWEGIEETDNDRDRGSLLFEERLERAERRMDAGNQLFKGGKHKEALAKYALALSYLDEDFMYQLEGHYLDKAEAVKLRVHLNMAAAQLKTGDFNTAIYNCGQVLSMDPRNVKALYRRGKARHALGRTEEAREDLEAALKIDPSDRSIVAEMHEVKATIKKEKLAQAALFQGLLGGKAVAGGPAAAAGSSSSSGATQGDQQQQQQRQSSSSAAAAANGSSSQQQQQQQQQQQTERAKRSPATSSGTSGGGKAGSGGSGGGGGSGLGRGQALAWLWAGLAWLWALILAAVMRKKTTITMAAVGVPKGRRSVPARSGSL